MSPSSAKERLFPPSVSPKLWREQLRGTTAIKQLESGQWESFPLDEVKQLTEALRRTSKNRIWSQGVVEPGSFDCHTLIVQALDGFKGELWAYAAGVVACVHAMDQDQLCGHLERLRDLCDPDTSFISRTQDYLQCLLLVTKSHPHYFEPEVHKSAKDLLLVVTDTSRLPSVMRVLKAMQNPSCEEFLPYTLVKEILLRTNYKENLKATVLPFIKSRKWLQVHRFLGGVGNLINVEPADRLLRYVIPISDRSMWAAWSPNIERITAWGNPIMDPFRERLGLFLLLEGPDSTGGTHRTYKESSMGTFGQDVLQLTPRNGHYIQDYIFTLFDRVVSKGAEAIRLFITLCVEPKTMNWLVVDQVEAALTLTSTSDIASLEAYVCAARTTDPLNSLSHFTKALRVIRPSPDLRRLFGDAFDIKYRSKRVLCQAQVRLSSELLDGKTNQFFAFQLSDLCHALLASTWLHEGWPPAYIARLRIVPKKAIIASIIRTMQTASPDLKLLCEDFLIMALYSSKVDDGKLQLGTLTNAAPALNEAIWQKSFDDDNDRELLRAKFLIAMIQGFGPADATACLKQADNEHDTFVRELRGVLENTSPDMVCVNMADFLVNQCGKRKPADCWKRLLMHMMRERSPDLHTRCAKELKYDPWTAWGRNLSKLYDGAHFHSRAGLGFTQAEFTRITASKMRISRMGSTSTYSTASTGRRAD